MKKIFILIAMSFVSLSVLLGGCTKQADNTPSMDAFIDGVQFTATGNNVVSTVNTTPSQLIITGTSAIFSPGTTFTPSIRIIVASMVGTHNINTDASAIVYTAATGSTGTNALLGQVNVTGNASGKISGNFNFTCANGTAVANGEFTANN